MVGKLGSWVAELVLCSDSAAFPWVGSQTPGNKIVEKDNINFHIFYDKEERSKTPLNRGYLV
jgi:hypothetical protein